MTEEIKMKNQYTYKGFAVNLQLHHYMKQTVHVDTNRSELCCHDRVFFYLTHLNV